MNFEMLFTTEEDGCEALTIRVRPTRYIRRLHPHKAMGKLEAYIDVLHQALFRHQDALTEEDLNRTEKLKKVRRVLFELEICHDYLAYLKEHYKTTH